MRMFVALIAAATLAACTHPVDTAGAPDFGASVAAMRDAQISHAEAAPGAPEGSGETGTLSQQRYRAGAPRQLLPSSTSLNNPGQ